MLYAFHNADVLIVSVLVRILIGPDSQTLMRAISSVKVDETDYLCVETHMVFPECAPINCVLLCLKYLSQQTIVLLPVWNKVCLNTETFSCLIMLVWILNASRCFVIDLNSCSSFSADILVMRSLVSTPCATDVTEKCILWFFFFF